MDNCNQKYTQCGGKIFYTTVYIAVLLCVVCLFDLACFFLPSFSSLIKTCIIIMIQYVHVQNVHVHEQLYDSNHYCFPITITL